MTGSLLIPESRLRQFFELLDLFPEYSRPGIEDIFKYVSQKEEIAVMQKRNDLYK